MEETALKLTKTEIRLLMNIIKDRTNDTFEELNALHVFHSDYSIKLSEMEMLISLRRKFSDAFISIISPSNESCEQSDDEQESKGDKKLKVVKLICDLGIKEGDYITYENGDEYLVIDTKHRKCVNYKGKAYSLCEIIQNVYNLNTNHAYEHFWFQGKKLSDLSKEAKQRG